MRFTKGDIQSHEKAQALISGCDPLAEESIILSIEDTLFCFDNWLPGVAMPDSSWRKQAFFTSYPLAQQVAMEFDGDGDVYVDICAGVGILAFALIQHLSDSGKKGTVICIEKEPAFIEIGKKLVPQAIWIEGDALSEELWDNLPMQPDFFITNPPFNIKTDKSEWLKAPEPCLGFIEAGLKKTRQSSGIAILPQKYASYVHTVSVRSHEGEKYRVSKVNENTNKFDKATTWEVSLDIQNSCPVFYAPELIERAFKGTSIQTEVIDYRLK
jgi:predicted RNA methylase